MAGGFTHILASRSDDGNWGGLCFAAILIVGWVIKAVSGAVKQASVQAERRRVMTGGAVQPSVGRPGSPMQIPPPLPGAQVRPGKAGATAAKATGRQRRPAVAVTAPLPPAVAPAASQNPLQLAAPPMRRQATAAAAKRDEVKAAMRTRVMWAEVLGKPLALREEDGEVV